MKLSLVLFSLISARVSGTLHIAEPDNNGHHHGGRAFERDAKTTLEPPVAAVVPHELTVHNDTRIDDYYWLNSGRDDPDVLRYLEEENNYTDAVMVHTLPLQRELFGEIKGRMKQDDSSVPVLYKNYYYYRRYQQDLEYPFHCRRRNIGTNFEEAGPEECVNVNDYAEGYSYFDFMGPTYNGNEQVAACSYDEVGRLFFTIFFLEKQDDSTNATNADDDDDYAPVVPSTTYTERIENVTYNYAWAADNTTLFYTKQDPVTLRWFQIWRHALGTTQDDDVLVYEEEDEEYDCGVKRSKSNAFVLIYSYKTLTREYRYIDALHPTRGQFRLFWPRQEAHEYWVQHAGDYWYIITNDPDTHSDNFKLMKTPVVAMPEEKEDEGEEGDKKRDNDTSGAIADKEDWIEIIPHRNDTLLWWFDVFINHIVVTQRYEGLRQMRIIPTTEGQTEHYLDFGEPVYYSDLGSNYQYNTSILRYEYESFTTPDSVFDYDMDTREKILLKQDEVVDESFAPTNYRSERLFATAGDGSRIPISMVYKKHIMASDGSGAKGNHPLLQHGYGAYGSSLDANFRINRLSLLDRGFIFVYAHVRGGQEMGAYWYEEGKLLNKMNTFTDFIAVSEFLIDEGYTSPQKLYCYGASAGGLLVGAVVNMAPQLYHGAIADVPWVDAVTTMLDETIPLVTAEWNEWGNPKASEEIYNYMLSYSPYDQIEEMDYPHILAYSGLHDSQVQYWEPTKWIAKLRTHKTNDNLLLLKTNMEAGHYGNTGRFQVIHETAFMYAFLLDIAGLNDVTEIQDDSMMTEEEEEEEDAEDGSSISVGGSLNVERDQDSATDEAGEGEGEETPAQDDSSSNADGEGTNEEGTTTTTGDANWGGDEDDLDEVEDVAIGLQSAASSRQFGMVARLVVSSLALGALMLS